MSEKPPPAFQFYASDYLSSSTVQNMPLDAQGAYIRLLCYSWEDGSIPADIKSLAKLCNISPGKMKKLWEFLRNSFSVAEENPQRLVNRRLESVRRDQANYRKRQQESGKLGNEIRWGRDRTATVSRSPEDRSPSPSSSPSSNSIKKEKKEGDSPHPEIRVGVPDPAADLFADAYLIKVGNPYGWFAGDFPQLAKLRRRLKLASKETPDKWNQAIEHYFGTGLSEYSLQHFASKFDTFMNSPLDRYKVPVNHQGANGNGNGAKNRVEKTIEAGARLRARLDLEDSGGDER